MSTTRGACVRIRRARPDDVRRIHEVEAASYATPWTLETFGSRGVLVSLVAEFEQDGDAPRDGARRALESGRRSRARETSRFSRRCGDGGSEARCWIAC